MKKFFISLFLSIKLFAFSSVEELSWEDGKTLLDFLQDHSIPLNLYYNLDTEDKESSAEIASGVKYQMLKDDQGNLEQVLIPISDDLQIHIYKNIDNKFVLSFTPISYIKEKRTLRVAINNSAYQDVYDESGSVTLARAMVRAFKNSVNFKNVKKGDSVILIYEQKRRLGRLFGDISINAALANIRGKEYSIFLYKDSYYNAQGKELENFFLTKPVQYTRISDRFTKARYHPILKRYRAHLGIDYAAPTGTPVKSAGDGVVSFIGTKGGYGKVIQIKHTSGYMTLYAHLSRFAKIKRNQKVKQGQVIAYVGSTGMSTGPHLHFGLYLNNKAINPETIVKIPKSSLSGTNKEEFLKISKDYQNILDNIKEDFKNPPKEQNIENSVEL
ncbi:peptidoglycan DD-metalloendopeptidase family protein [Campylobacter insulaenigrae]|uniref:Zinc metallopeptidase, M23 family n=2 Tax=Campylobacter insulaenigrae TaxID=260714 RepID=A0A0A8H215_9BACT|nr:peptidoglycan DD-metalloendopeptidase family protein [Campylobacter insulaenigrae]AJC88141.1 zinc metallopeptidase, M23 family [Campylobacter insulaenigrae NCTC 12927]MCR6570694.1 peptidoglycan DD-metalloendopeptidase family protein [Campylobacter insulaenigrae]MCR6572377.1 peptidoglycan DD-metalloendopeptidase family protein [Campylobacter insulaenigrae]MCR6573869.1 peptidoglycan DD-metalloendopeptidase family protein [Campylobacter insulaenigrae]MCR6575067.1 peptidoglycan DD-metalloendope